MKKAGKTIILIIIGLLVILAGVTVIRQWNKFDAPYPDIKASKVPEVITRGQYLVTATAHCSDCHSSPNNISLVNNGDVAELSGGKEFNLPIGKITSPNITSDKLTGIGNLSDKEIARALRFGVGHDGRALFPFMNYQDLTNEDLTAIISYIRTLPPQHNDVKIRNFNLLGYIANAFLIKPVGPSAPSRDTLHRDTTVAYGKYLALNVSGCRDCHTNRNLQTGEFTGPEYAGGFHMESDTDPKHYECITPNLTSDNSTGVLANWSENAFINRFKAGKVISHSPMPWGPFKRIEDNDLKAIYKFLKTLSPIKNSIPNTLVKLK